MKQNTSDNYCPSSKNHKHNFQLVVTDGKTGLVKCFHCAKTKRIGV